MVFADYQEKATYGLGYILTIKRMNDSVALSRNATSVDGQLNTNTINWYVPLYTASVIQGDLMNDRIIPKFATEPYVKRSVSKNLWNNKVSGTFN